MSSSTSVETFVGLQRTLLALEREAEVAQAAEQVGSTADLEKKGIGLMRMSVASQRTGMYGRTVVTLQRGLQKPVELPSHVITSGDIVGLRPSKGPAAEMVSGVVTSVAPSSLSVAFDAVADGTVDLDGDAQYTVAKLANDVTYKRLKSAIDRLESVGSVSALAGVLFGNSQPSAPLQSLSPKIVDHDGGVIFLNDKLNECQREAVRFSLLQKELAVVHGPPGTGKTTTVVEIVCQAVRSGLKVLCCAPSNVAVDNLLQGITAFRKVVPRPVRIGHPARINLDLQKYSLDALIGCSETTQIVRDVRSDIDKAVASFKKNPVAAKRELRELRKELWERERAAVKEVLTGADVVLATLTSASPEGPLKNVAENHFDVVIIDECSQATEMACWIALPFVRKTILAGDHHQLPPTIISNEAAFKGLELTLMERVISLWPDAVRMLTTQYRMNSAIMNWSSKAMYDGRLEAHSSVEGRLLSDIDSVQKNEETDIPLLLIDTTGCEMREVVTADEISKANEGEVALVCVLVDGFVKSGLSPQDIAVITPYNLQVELIRLQLSTRYPRLEVKSVDGFQGREKEAVVLTLVRSNPAGEIGFLAERRRLNVAVTRAKRHVAVICDVDTVSHDPFIKEFVDYMTEHGEVRSAMQYQGEVDAADIARPDGMDLILKDYVKKKPVGKKDVSTQKSKKKPKKTQGSSDKSEMQGEAAALPHGEGRREDDETKRDRFLSVIEAFVADKKETVLRFPPDLNSHDRMVVHEIAGELGLAHESVGEAKERRIIVSKKEAKGQSGAAAANKEKAAPANASSISTPKKATAEVPQEATRANKKASFGASRDEGAKEDNGASPSTEDEEEDPTVECANCGTTVPKANLDLHTLRCQRPPTATADLSVKPKKSKGNKAKKGKTKPAAADDEDFDKVVDEFAKKDSRCSQEKCKTKVTVLGANCDFCRRRLCLEHGLPEAHGCGEAARRAARQQISRDGKLFPGSGRPNTKPDAVRSAQLHRRMDKKLAEMKDARKAKKPEKK